jgi:hypothetical protein
MEPGPPPADFQALGNEGLGGTFPPTVRRRSESRHSAVVHQVPVTEPQSAIVSRVVRFVDLSCLGSV